MISINDYKTSDGRTDWDAYKKAQIAVGERCNRCGAYMVSLRNRGPRPCFSCEEMDTDTDACTHENLIRCPECRRQMTVDEIEAYELYDEGEHEIGCPHCGADFEVTTYVEHSFTSPPIRQAEAA